jgi:type IV pilus assembly PilN-like protein
MRPLTLDYVREPIVWPGWLLLLAALAVAGETGHSYWAAKAQLAELQAASGGAPRRAQSKLVHKTAYPGPLKENLAYANSVVQNLALPWDMLFKTVEGTGNVPVALLAVQPDAQKGMVRISGEAKDYAAVLTYLARLDGSGSLRNVHLLSHQLKQDDPQRPLLFTIAASWKLEP